MEHFDKKEFLCPCCGMGEVSEMLVMWLSVLRMAWGKPVIVNSGWRCAAHNMKVGGTRTSRHMLGCAADISLMSTARAGHPERQDFLLLARRLCARPSWEFIANPTFIHIAVPREEADRKWNGERIKI